MFDFEIGSVYDACRTINVGMLGRKPELPTESSRFKYSSSRLNDIK